MAAEAAMGYVIETFGKMMIEEAKFLVGVADQVEDLKLELERLRSFLREAEARQDEQRDIQVWISQSRDFAYEAEDLLEEYAFKIASQRENIIKRSVCFLKECYVRQSIGSEIQKLKSKISGLTRSFQDYGIRPSEMEREDSSSSSQRQQQQLRRTHSHVVDEGFIELDNDVQMLVGNLVNENENSLHGVVSIYGMGGLGKTTLARKVYNHNKVKRYFENLAWICISQQWQSRDILQGILIKFMPQKRKEIMEWREEELIRELSQVLKSKKCLVVFDDMWSTDAWDSIKDAFPITEKGNKLLVTTRDRSVALHVDPIGFHHEPRLLSDLESWELLQTKAIRERSWIGHEEMLEMEGLGKEMVKHCGGLPLAVVVLGGILATKRDIKEWRIVHSNVKAHILRGKNVVKPQGEVEKILALSYNDLPPKLKACFLYLGRFPKDSEIDVERLCQLWLAEEMISVRDQISEEPMMDVAERYLEELAERSMVQVKVDDDIDRVTLTKFQHCRLHDLLRDLSLVKAKKENFFSFVRFQNGFDDQVYKSSSRTSKIHRLVIHFQEEDVPKYIPPQKRISKHLRSLKLFVEDTMYHEVTMPWTTKFQFRWFRMLRVLEIHGLQRPSLKSGCKRFFFQAIDYLGLSEGIGNLIHLRYLCLGGDLFFCLPSSLGNLKQFQTLDLRSAPSIRVPNILWKMRELKHLYLPDFDLSNFRCQKLRLDGLNNLEIFKNFDNRYCSCEDLVKLTNLQHFEASLIDNFKDIDEILRYISNSKRLLKVSLYIAFSTLSVSGDKGYVVITKLLSCPKLTKLQIEMPISNLPKYEAGFALDLVSLKLLETSIESDPMKTLERLPNLKFLTLNCSYIGAEMQCCADGFPQLKQLRLWDLRNFEEWIIAQGAMPKLSYLSISRCQKLQRIPDGLRFITTLKELHVYGMPREFNGRLKGIDGEKGEDFYKIQHVTVVKVIESLLEVLIRQLRNSTTDFNI